jgi:hypothetical protein
MKKNAVPGSIFVQQVDVGGMYGIDHQPYRHSGGFIEGLEFPKKHSGNFKFVMFDGFSLSFQRNFVSSRHVGFYLSGFHERLKPEIQVGSPGISESQ